MKNRGFKGEIRKKQMRTRGAFRIWRLQETGRYGRLLLRYVVHNMRGMQKEQHSKYSIISTA
ncbi:hypothetical protein ADH76_02445 [Enterocloster clostridioformis]|nr:hypothetical protein A4V08_01980 [Lachnoclostridium sp. YL32]OXE70324.1 hypothetical protein ADH76_02445 [Enterocloster clostridioformis]